MQIHWHRRDLRAADNRALAAAAEAAGAGSGEEETDASSDGEGVVPVFVFDDAVLEHGAPARVRYLLDALAELRSWYRERGSDLVVARDDPAAALPDLAAEYGADRVVWNEDYSGLARERDARVERALDERGVDRASFRDAVFHGPGSITTNEGEPYSTFTYYWKKWRDREKPDPIPAPDPDALAPVSGDELPTIADLGFDEPDADVQDAGTEAARERLEAFCDGPIRRYAEDRDYPAREGVSRLSADLKFGTIGVREVYEATERAEARVERDRGDSGPESSSNDEEERPDPIESIDEFRSQLAWREFYAQVIYFDPNVVSENFRSYENGIEWRNDPEELAAWKAGVTGYPIVDAGMRQLRSEAYLHNRVRMIVASFLTKDLLIDWREGYAHFRDRLADHDPANDSGGWQWAASTGTDAQPYFRIFNPTTQGERYDPEATYIREHVPELRGVDVEDVHAWPDLSPDERERLAPEYPAPIVDHAERREAALAMFEAARGGE